MSVKLPLNCHNQTRYMLLNKAMSTTIQMYHKASRYIKHIIRRTSINRHAYLQLRYVYRHCNLYIYCNCNMYIGTALYYIATAICISAKHLYIATAICLLAQHFIWCNCDMYIGSALYILRLRYVYRQCTLYIATAIYIYLHSTLYIAPAICTCISAAHFIYCNCDMYIGTALCIHAHRDLVAGAVYACACACALSDAMAGTGPGKLSGSQVAQLSSAVVTAVSQAFSSVNGAQGQAEQSECSFLVGRPDATRSLTGTSSNTRYFCPDIVIIMFNMFSRMLSVV